MSAYEQEKMSTEVLVALVLSVSHHAPAAAKSLALPVRLLPLPAAAAPRSTPVHARLNPTSEHKYTILVRSQL
jgi:hypothetical protein